MIEDVVVKAHGAQHDHNTCHVRPWYPVGTQLPPVAGYGGDQLLENRVS